MARKEYKKKQLLKWERKDKSNYPMWCISMRSHAFEQNTKEKKQKYKYKKIMRRKEEINTKLIAKNLSNRIIFLMVIAFSTRFP